MHLVDDGPQSLIADPRLSLCECFVSSPGEVEHPPFDLLQQRPSPVSGVRGKPRCGFRAPEPLVELDLVGKSL